MKGEINKLKFKELFKRFLGVLGIFILTGIYIQAVPFLVLFLSGLIGIKTDFNIDVHLIVWIITSISIVIPTIYYYIKTVNKLWFRLVLLSK